MSPKSTSAMSPMLTTCEKPMPRGWAQSSTAERTALDWVRNASDPGSGIRWAKLAFRPAPGT